MTEEEARQKWCFLRTLTDEPGTVYPRGIPNTSGRCLGSACMMWRWAMRHTHGRAYDSLTDGGYVQEVPGDKPLPADHGYCGLAGRL